MSGSLHSLNWYAKASMVELMTHGILISDNGYFQIEESPGSVAELLYIEDSCRWKCISSFSMVLW